MANRQHLGVLRRDARGPTAVDIRGSARFGVSPQATSDAGVRVPVLGTIAAGTPILAKQDVEEVLTLPVAMVGRGMAFALHVRGDSMIDATICDGDVVVVRQQAVTENGDIVAALIDGDATMKVYRAQGGRVELVPRNPQYEVINAEHTVILGKVVCVPRRI